MLIITGAAGFIGSCLVRKLNDEGYENLILVDDFTKTEKVANWEGKKFLQKVNRSLFLDWLAMHHQKITFIFHLGARTDTTEQSTAIFDELNLNYSKGIWQRCVRYNIPMLYASSAATYGLGELGYEDRHDIVPALRPLNPYGVSKNDFDAWALQQTDTPPFWAGMKFFNVYGPNEYHKGRMASVIFHTARQIEATGTMQLFQSHRAEVKDGAQSRDFIYVKDVVNICFFLFQQQPENGLYNVGTGKARTFLDLATNTFLALGKTPSIRFVETPLDIRDTYQYFTEATMRKLHAVGYNTPFYSLEEGIEDYVKSYLKKKINN
jgi:ADP-L-glycero-D-manno-heptose 6-epimerase